MLKKKIWILNHNTEDIQSVNRISQNLSELYLSLPSDLYEVSEINLMDLEATESVKNNFKSRLAEFRVNTPEHVVIINPSITHHPFLRALLFIKTTTTPQFVFHVLGNFIRYGESWFSLNHLLSNKHIQFVVASKCYFELLTNFIPKECLSVLPFPVSLTEGKRDPLAIKKESEVLNVLYTGRYHEQKNVTQLILALNEISKDTGMKICLNLVGYFDDFNPTTISSDKLLGKQFEKYTIATSNLAVFFEVNFLPHQESEELRLLYLNNDVLISFSTFLDEDYGNTIIESLTLGTPCIVSRWGGYKDFCQEFPDDCLGLDVVLEEEKIYLETEKLLFYLDMIAKRTPAQRENLKHKTLRYVGQAKLQQTMTRIFSTKRLFKGFDQALLSFSQELGKDLGKGSLGNFKNFYKSFW